MGKLKFINILKKIAIRSIIQSYSIIIIIHSKNFLDKQNEETRNRIIIAIEKLPTGDIKRLKGLDGFRLRVGTFRIIFN